MSSALLLTATSDEASTRGGGPFHVFDCLGCFGNAGKSTFKTYLEAVFPGRITLHDGLSSKTLPAFRRRNPETRCDIFHIDGSHERKDVVIDLDNARDLSHAETLVLLDDTNPGGGPYGAVQEVVRAGTMQIVDTVTSIALDPIMATYRGYRNKNMTRRIGNELQKHWQFARFLYPSRSILPSTNLKLKLLGTVTNQKKDQYLA